MPDEPSVPPSNAGLLLSRDLIFTSKITGTARALGLDVRVSGGFEAAKSLLARWRPRAIFVDLSAGELTNASALNAYRTLVGAGTPLVAFGSHVDAEALQSAREAGCDPVLPRSRFVVELPGLLTSLLGDEPNRANKNT